MLSLPKHPIHPYLYPHAILTASYWDGLPESQREPYQGLITRTL